MFCRVSAAVAAAAIAAMLLVPAQLNARGGAGLGGHGGGFHPPVRPSHLPVRPLVHRHDPLFVHRKFHERHAFEHRHRRNVDGFVGAGYGGGGYGGNGYGDNGYGDNGYGDYGYGAYHYCNYGYRDRYPFTCADYSAFYGKYYDPSDVPGSTYVPPYTVRPALILSIAGRVDPPITRGGCRSEAVTISSPGGAERSVTITRC
jgi:hypothetical protein